MKSSSGAPGDDAGGGAGGAGAGGAAMVTAHRAAPANSQCLPNRN